MTTTHTCTVVVGFDQRHCGEPAVTSFTSRRGVTYHECAKHDMRTSIERLVRETAESLGIKTRTAKPYVLVCDGAVVGYAESAGPAVAKRAAKLGARIIPTK